MSDAKSGAPPGAVRCAVGRVVRDAEVPYFVAHVQAPVGELDRHDTVTVSLDAWQGPGDLKPGLLVDVTEVRRFTGGWRGSSASAITPEKGGANG